MIVPVLFAEKSSNKGTLQAAVAQLNEPKKIWKGKEVAKYDELAQKYTGKYVYVLRGQFKAKVGVAKSMGGEMAEVSLIGGATGQTMESIRREYLVR